MIKCRICRYRKRLALKEKQRCSGALGSSSASAPGVRAQRTGPYPQWVELHPHTHIYRARPMAAHPCCSHFSLLSLHLGLGDQPGVSGRCDLPTMSEAQQLAQALIVAAQNAASASAAHTTLSQQLMTQLSAQNSGGAPVALRALQSLHMQARWLGCQILSPLLELKQSKQLDLTSSSICWLGLELQIPVLRLTCNGSQIMLTQSLTWTFTLMRWLHVAKNSIQFWSACFATVLSKFCVVFQGAMDMRFTDSF